MSKKEYKSGVFALTGANAKDLAVILRRVGADPRALRYLAPKRRVLTLFAPHVDYRAANFLKQEMLARGGDVAVSHGAIDASEPFAPVLMMGTDSQFARLLEKMKAMDCWGLTELRGDLARCLAGGDVREWTLSLPGGRSLSLNAETKLMGILNVTPDSFHADSRVGDESDLLRRAGAMLEAGAAVLDVGAESTRPGAAPVSPDEERARLLPAIKALRREFASAIISVDTYRGETALAAADAGADIINDVGGGMLDESWDASLASLLHQAQEQAHEDVLNSKHMFACAAKSGLPYVLSHTRGTPLTMGEIPEDDDTMTELHMYFDKKIALAAEAGLDVSKIILDPGIGFGKNGRENFVILKELEALRCFGRPLLVGHSRKRFTGSTARLNPEDRLPGTLAVTALLDGRVELLRVHDVPENQQAMLTARAIRETSPWRA